MAGAGDVMTPAPILSNAELARERAVLAHLETDVRVTAQARRRADRIAEKALARSNLAGRPAITVMPVQPR